MTPATLGNTREVTATARHWIDGGWRDSPRHSDSINPATGEVIGRYAVAGEDDARQATAAALRAFRESNWKSDRALRSRALYEMAECFEAHAADLIQLVSLETGKVVPEATFEVSLAASGLRIARELEVGTVWVNDWVMMRDEFEEGGYKGGRATIPNGRVVAGTRVNVGWSWHL